MLAPILSGQHQVYHFLSIAIPHISQFRYTTASTKVNQKARKFATKMPKWAKIGQNFSIFMLKTGLRKKYTTVSAGGAY